MDLSAFIFVALAAAWTAYLVPKALRHHEDVVRHRSVDRVGHTARVLAHREAVDSRTSRLVVDAPHAAASTTTVAAASRETPSFDPRAHKLRVQRATRRRRNVLLTLLLAAAVVTTLAGFGVVPWLATAAPAALLVAWLVACRVMVRSEHAALPTALQPTAESVATPVEAWADADTSTSIPAVRASEASIDPTLWDPVPVTLPTYVTKPAAPRRRVQSIELDDTGVWSSGRSELDSLLAREAEAVERARQRRADEEQRALGS